MNYTSESRIQNIFGIIRFSIDEYGEEWINQIEGINEDIWMLITQGESTGVKLVFENEHGKFL